MRASRRLITCSGGGASGKNRRGRWNPRRTLCRTTRTSCWWRRSERFEGVLRGVFRPKHFVPVGAGRAGVNPKKSVGCILMLFCDCDFVAENDNGGPSLPIRGCAHAAPTQDEPRIVSATSPSCPQRPRGRARDDRSARSRLPVDPVPFRPPTSHGGVAPLANFSTLTSCAPLLSLPSRSDYLFKLLVRTRV